MSKPWVLVTGASGFIGARLVRALVERGERVKAFVRAGSSLKMLEDLPYDRCRLAVGDITISHTVYRALSECDRMYHVASNFQMWNTRPERILEPAIEGTRATLEAARRRGLEKIVVTSSVGALGTTQAPEPMDEGHEFNLRDPETYVLSKYEAERVALEAADDGLPVVVVLPAAVSGPGDWKPTPTGQGIVTYLKSSPAFRMPVPDGGLNIVDVDDVVDGHIRAMERGSIGERYILGGEDLTFRQMFETLSDLTGLAPPGGTASGGLVQLIGRLMELRARFGGRDPELTYRLARDYSTSYAWVTSERAEKELGYSHRPARETLARAVRWYLEHGYVPDKAARRVRLELRPT
ncbi:MAG: NAD-dependent epimerase/dehydratase family protein [Myxococcales bacterium]|nr:NAD-dependent epimerase/dehydratase family protein [Myxococcales bacterium]MCB9582591.1 NAD-dependent epimerase/dehydratase family protein [Polyangiaceae bacterium]